MDIQVFFELAQNVKDPRKRVSRVKYSVTQILTITTMGVLSGCEDWHEIEEFGKAHSDYLRKFFPDLKKAPSHDTLERFFSLLKPKVFEKAFRIWVIRYFPKPQGPFGSLRKQGAWTTGKEGSHHLRLTRPEADIFLFRT